MHLRLKALPFLGFVFIFFILLLKLVLFLILNMDIVLVVRVLLLFWLTFRILLLSDIYRIKLDITFLIHLNFLIINLINYK